MVRKMIGKALLFPHIAVLILLFPIATVTVIYSLMNPDSNTIFVYGSYALSAYTLTIWCVRIPNIIKFVKTFRNENKYARIWFGDTRLRVNASLLFSTLWNAGYGAFQLELGVYHRSAWFYSLAGYYICLALMRFFLVRHSVKNHPGEKMREELRKYRTCGWIFLLMNLALSVMMFYMVAKDLSLIHI